MTLSRLLWLLHGLLVPLRVHSFTIGDGGALRVIHRQPYGTSSRGAPRSFLRSGEGDVSKYSGVLRVVEGAKGVRFGAVSSPGVADARETLRQAVETRSAPKDEVSAALEALEAGGATVGLEVGEVEGLWELVFSTQLPSGYMPVRELIGFYPSRDQITIDTTVGPLPLGGVRGQCSWNGGPSNELAFAISAAKFGPITIGREPKLKTYSFFYCEEELLAAKSSAGSLSLLFRVPEENA